MGRGSLSTGATCERTRPTKVPRGVAVVTARRFGDQGEGAIEGVVGDYRRVALDEHGGARFALFGWCRGGGEDA